MYSVYNVIIIICIRCISLWWVILTRNQGVNSQGLYWLIYFATKTTTSSSLFLLTFCLTNYHLPTTYVNSSDYIQAPKTNFTNQKTILQATKLIPSLRFEPIKDYITQLQWSTATRTEQDDPGKRIRIRRFRKFYRYWSVYTGGYRTCWQRLWYRVC